MQMEAKKKKKQVGVAIYVSGKIDFKKSCNKRQRMTFHNDKGINLTRGYNS